MTLAYARFLESLEARGFKYKGNGHGRARAQCPAHNGDDLNLAVAVGDQGVLLKCMSYDCPAEDIAHAVGLELGDLFDEDGRAVYDYGNGHHVVRERTRDGKTIYQVNHPGNVTELYRHPDSASIEDSDLVVLVEGEKSVDAALRLGLACVTTWPGGTGGVNKVNIDPLSGKRVRLIADHDEPGFAAMGHMAMRLQGIATVEGIFTAPKNKQGIDDVWLDGGTLDDLIEPDLGHYMKPVDDEPDMVIDFLSSHSSKPMQWLWKGIIPNGAAVIFAGMGGVSKSTFALWLAGRITRGLVVGTLEGQPSVVLYVSHEDGIDDVVLPRAQVNGVDTSKFATLGVPMKESNGVMMPKFPDDLGRLEKAIRKVNAKVVIIDPIVSSMKSGKDPNALLDAREVIDPLNQLAQRLGISIICIAHTNKGATNARTAITGSGAWVDATRGSLIFAMDPPEPDAEYTDVIIGAAKANYGPSGGAYTYRVTSVDHLHDNGEVYSTPKIQWLGTSQRSVDDVLNANTEDRRLGGLSQEIRRFIDSQNGAVSVKAILDEFREEKVATVRVTLSRLAKSGKIDSPAYGIYQSMKFARQR